MVSPRKLKKFLKAVLSSLLPNNSSSWVYKTQGTSLESPSPDCIQQHHHQLPENEEGLARALSPQHQSAETSTSSQSATHGHGLPMGSATCAGRGPPAAPQPPRHRTQRC